MLKRALYTTAALTLILALAPPAARAQEHDAPKLEVGAQATSLSIKPPDFFTTQNLTGFGARVTYNLTDYLAVEAEGDFYPAGLSHFYLAGGRAEQAQFGLKVGKRFEKFGVFAKARPGFVSFGEAVKATQGTVEIGGFTYTVNVLSEERATHFSADVGGVLELYPSRRLLVRFDLGDTIIRYGKHDSLFSLPLFPFPNDVLTVGKVPDEVTHNFQFTAGVAYRFRGGAGKDEGARASASSTSKRRFEAGVQFSSFALNLNPADDFGFPFDNGNTTEVGLGARFGYNLNDDFALEVEDNFYPRRAPINSSTGGQAVQLQLGPKVGRRFRRFGLFAKARPGFVTFSRVLTRTGVGTLSFGGQPFFFPLFEDRRRTYFSADLGGVLEFYPSSRLLTRFDFGDTLIRYGVRSSRNFTTSAPPPDIPASTRHNFQFTAGVGLRF